MHIRRRRRPPQQTSLRSSGALRSRGRILHSSHTHASTYPTLIATAETHWNQGDQNAWRYGTAPLDELATFDVDLWMALASASPLGAGTRMRRQLSASYNPL